MTTPTTERFADTVIIVIGNNHCWGKGATLEEARRNASRPAKYVAYIAAADTRVSEFDGALTWTRGHAPRLIAFKGVDPMIQEHGLLLKSPVDD